MFALIAIWRFVVCYGKGTLKLTEYYAFRTVFEFDIVECAH